MTSSKEESAQKKSDFSIEHILTKAGNKNSEIEFRNMQQGLMAFSWLNCTRYCPPKLPRTQKKEGPQKRQLGRHPRIPFSSHQLAVLEEKFKLSPYLSSAEVTQLSRTLQLADIRVKIWFQNRRARERREKNEQETQLKATCSTITNEVNVKQETSNEKNLPSPLVFELLPTTTTTNQKEQKHSYTHMQEEYTNRNNTSTLEIYENYHKLSRYVPSQHLS